jgi:hypothetical protein
MSSSYIVTIIFTNKLNCSRIAVNVDHHPKGCTGVNAAEKDALVVSVNVEHHITTGREVEREQDADINVPLG